MVTLSNSSISHMGKLRFRSLLPPFDLVSYKFKTRMQAPFSEFILMCMPTMCYAWPGLPSPRSRTFLSDLVWKQDMGPNIVKLTPPSAGEDPVTCRGKKQVMMGWSGNCVHSFIHALLHTIHPVGDLLVYWGPVLSWTMKYDRRAHNSWTLSDLV